MSSCVFKVAGDGFDVDRFLSESSFSPYSIFKKGESYGRFNKVHANSGFKLSLSNAGDVYLTQVLNVRRFLSDFKKDLGVLSVYPGVDRLVLDFGVSINCKVALAEFEVPFDLASELGALQIDVVISVYLFEEYDEKEE